MLTVHSMSEFGKDHHTYWKIGDPELHFVSRGKIVSIQATEREKEMVLATIQGIRKTDHAEKILWTGEDAEFIYWNLRTVDF